MQLPSLDGIYKIIVAIALGYLIFSILNLINVSSKNIDKIEKSQELIMKSAKDIILSHDKAAIVADSLDKVHIQQLQNLTNQVNVLQTQLKSVQTEIKTYKQVFDKNKVDLPNPWQK